jgi:hypothetical protein
MTGLTSVVMEWFSQVLWFPPPIKTDRHDIADILLKVALNTIALCSYGLM